MHIQHYIDHIGSLCESADPDQFRSMWTLFCKSMFCKKLQAPDVVVKTLWHIYSSNYHQVHNCVYKMTWISMF